VRSGDFLNPTYSSISSISENNQAKTKAATDDAAEVFWMPLGDIAKNAENFFEDHLHIIEYFV
jgi:hypothetical protein